MNLYKEMVKEIRNYFKDIRATFNYELAEAMFCEVDWQHPSLGDFLTGWDENDENDIEEFREYYGLNLEEYANY